MAPGAGGGKGRTVKVLLINNGKGWSGGQEHLKDLAVELRRRGAEVHFQVRGDTVNETRFKALGFPVHVTPYRYGTEGVKAFFRLVSLLRRARFDIVSINREHDLLPTVLACRLAFPLRRIGRLMMSYHLPTARRQLFLGEADAVVCISEHVREKLLRTHPRAAAKTSVLYYGIVLPPPPGPEKFTADRPRRFFSGRGFPVIGMVGEFWKNQVELVEMIPALAGAFPGITVAFVGNNANRDLVGPVEERIRQLGVEDKVVFTGLVPRDRIMDVFYDMDISVTTHRNEGFGIVHLESLAAGTPVVAYDEGGFVDIFRGENAGILVGGGTADFSRAVVDLLSDHGRRFAMGAAGYDLVKRRYSVEAMGDTYLDFYRRIGSR